MVDIGIGDSFWEEWLDRLRNEKAKFITPTDKPVQQEVRKIDFDVDEDDAVKAKKAWVHVESNIKYKLSAGWKTPRETLRDGVGDCEDVMFLLASMFPNMGIDESKIVVGNLVFQDGKVEEHTWNEVDGMVIDATGKPSDVSKLTYRERGKITITTNG